eukprot:12052075-Alexandrium_andersonii.AAC.1
MPCGHCAVILLVVGVGGFVREYVDALRCLPALGKGQLRGRRPVHTGGASRQGASSGAELVMRSCIER